MSAIDWRRPWLAPLASMGRRVAARVQAGAGVADALNALIDEPSALAHKPLLVKRLRRMRTQRQAARSARRLHG
mgnify:CR=1 FL=1